MQRGYNYTRPARGERGEGEGEGERTEEALEEGVKKLLDRVLVMRVFDFVGVVEAVGEIGAGLEREIAPTCRESGEVADSEDEEVAEGEIEEGKAGAEMSHAMGRVGMIVVDSMTNVVSAMMKRDHVQGTITEAVSS